MAIAIIIIIIPRENKMKEISVQMFKYTPMLKLV